MTPNKPAQADEPKTSVIPGPGQVGTKISGGESEQKAPVGQFGQPTSGGTTVSKLVPSTSVPTSGIQSKLTAIASKPAEVLNRETPGPSSKSEAAEDVEEAVESDSSEEDTSFCKYCNSKFDSLKVIFKFLSYIVTKLKYDTACSTLYSKRIRL